MKHLQGLFTRKVLVAFGGLLCFSTVSGADYINQNFEGYAVGALSSGSGWSISANISTRVVETNGNKYVSMARTASGANVYSSANAPNTPLTLSSGKNYRWAFRFFVDSATPDSAGNKMFIYLDTGAAAGGFAGLIINYASNKPRAQVYNTLTGGITSSSNYITLGNLEPDEWYSAEFIVYIDNTEKMRQKITVGSYTHETTVQDSNAGAGNVRMCWSPQLNGTTMSFDDINLRDFVVKRLGLYIINN
ncbi:MAG: hypothetical protein WC959_11105 [Kiritimatiellales bacterium]